MSCCCWQLILPRLEDARKELYKKVIPIMDSNGDLIVLFDREHEIVATYFLWATPRWSLVFCDSPLVLHFFQGHNRDIPPKAHISPNHALTPPSFCVLFNRWPVRVGKPYMLVPGWMAGVLFSGDNEERNRHIIMAWLTDWLANRLPPNPHNNLATRVGRRTADCRSLLPQQHISFACVNTRLWDILWRMCNFK